MNGPKNYSRIRVRESNQRVFRIGECTTDVKLSNLVLRAEPAVVTSPAFELKAKTQTYGVEALGKINTSQHISISNVSFEFFDIGFHAHSPQNWQFDFVKVDHCYFIRNKRAGINIDTPNSDWSITATNFYMASLADGEADGIKIRRAGAVLISQTFGYGNNYTDGIGGDFVEIISGGPYTIMNSASEKTTHSIVYGVDGGGGTFSNPITLINNVLIDKIWFPSGGTLVSSGNQYGPKTFVRPNGNPGLNLSVAVYSTGDRFCYDANAGYNPPHYYPCGATTGNPPTAVTDPGGFTGGRVVFQTGQVKDVNWQFPSVFVNERPAIVGTNLQVNGKVISDDTNNSPVLILNTTNYLKPLLEFGHIVDENVRYTYKFSRIANGWLYFEGTQDKPTRGYEFDAPIKVPSMTYSEMIAYSTATAGTMLYCTNCVRNTDPCQQGGTGALVVFANNQWRCQ